MQARILRLAVFVANQSRTLEEMKRFFDSLPADMHPALEPFLRGIEEQERLLHEAEYILMRHENAARILKNPEE